MRSPLLVPETMRLDDLLRTMQQQRLQIAIAIDEFGGTAGLVTLEDLLERIFGEVQDEFERPETDVEMLPDGSALIDGLTLIDDVNDRFGLHLDDTDYDTIGGYVFGELGRRPDVDDEITVENRTLQVAALDGLRIARVRLSPPVAAKETNGETPP
jgi:magnesium and cobalt exporter, CNNM family